jgi:hypothetical protein
MFSLSISSLMVAVVPVLQERLLDAVKSWRCLRAVGAVDQSGVLALPGLREALAGSQRFSPPVFWPYGIPLKVRTPPSTKPRTLPYCVLATAVLGVEQVSGLLMHGGFDAVRRLGWASQRGSYAAGGGQKQRLAAIERDAIFGI